MTWIPITFRAVPLATPVRAVNIDQLLQIIAQQLSGEVDGAFAGLPQLATLPTYDQGLVYNTTSRAFYAWSTAQSKYVPITTVPLLGEVKLTYRINDEPATGYVVLDGRPIASISGLSETQATNAAGLFGTTLPSLTISGAYYKVFVGYP